MKENFNYCENAPSGFCFCLKTDCSVASECLRGLAARDLSEKLSSVLVINPLLLKNEDGKTCRFFRKMERRKLAFGFKRAKSLLPSGRVAFVKEAICKHVCVRDYYYMLGGTKPMQPALQEKIAAILVENGVPAPIIFDRYEWKDFW